MSLFLFCDGRRRLLGPKLQALSAYRADCVLRSVLQRQMPELLSPLAGNATSPAAAKRPPECLDGEGELKLQAHLSLESLALLTLQREKDAQVVGHVSALAASEARRNSLSRRSFDAGIVGAVLRRWRSFRDCKKEDAACGADSRRGMRLAKAQRGKT